MNSNLPRLSRFFFTGMVDHKGQIIPGKWPGFRWKNSTPSRIIVADTSNQGRPDLIAAEHLGSSEYWWVIVYFNNATDINWPRAGSEVKIPVQSEVLTTNTRESG